MQQGAGLSSWQMTMGLGFIASLTESMMRALYRKSLVIFAFVLEPDGHRWEVCLKGCGCSLIPSACPWAGSWSLHCCKVWGGKKDLTPLDRLLEVGSLFGSLSELLFFKWPLALIH